MKPQRSTYTRYRSVKCRSVHTTISVHAHEPALRAQLLSAMVGVWSAILPAGRNLMSLNIKNEEGHQLARELPQQGIGTRIRRLRAIRKRCARLLKAGGPSAIEHGDLLYGENGLPN